MVCDVKEKEGCNWENTEAEQERERERHVDAGAALEKH